MADEVRAGMEMLAWAYDPDEWLDQLNRRERILRGRGAHVWAALGKPPATWQLLESVRDACWTKVLITTAGIFLESEAIVVHSDLQRRPISLFESRLWRNEREPLATVHLVSSGWDVLCLGFTHFGLIAKDPVTLPVPNGLRSDIEEVAEILWRKTLLEGADDSSPPKWPRE